jgi:SPP1 gp7 family putative phage head morphogenesis protein
VKLRIHKRGRAPRMRQPDTARLDYYRALREYVRAAHRLVRERLLAILPELVEHGHDQAGRRVDANPGGRVNTKMGQIRAALDRAFPTEELARWPAQAARATSEIQKRELFRQVKAIAGISLESIADGRLSGRIRQFTAANVALIKSIPSDYFSEVEQVITAGVAAGTAAGDLADEVEERFGVAEDRAKVIARDQVGKFYASLNETRQTSLGIDRYIWRTAEDERVRDEHDDFADQEYAWDDPPGDGSAREGTHPGTAINCRCWPEPVIPEDEETAPEGDLT